MSRLSFTRVSIRYEAAGVRRSVNVIQQQKKRGIPRAPRIVSSEFRETMSQVRAARWLDEKRRVVSQTFSSSSVDVIRSNPRSFRKQINYRIVFVSFGQQFKTVPSGTLSSDNVVEVRHSCLNVVLKTVGETSNERVIGFPFFPFPFFSNNVGAVMFLLVKKPRAMLIEVSDAAEIDWLFGRIFEVAAGRNVFRGQESCRGHFGCVVPRPMVTTSLGSDHVFTCCGPGSGIPRVSLDRRGTRRASST